MRGAGIRVLIVGAGIAGLAAARTLRAWGAQIELVDRVPAPAPEGTGLYLPANAVRALDALGVGAAVADRAVHLERQRMSDHRGRVLVDIDVDAWWAGVAPCLALHRADLHQIMLDGAAGIPIRWGETVHAVRPRAGGGVAVELSGGEIGQYDLVLGADGVHSTVRRLVFPGQDARRSAQYARRFVIPWPDQAPIWSLLLGRGSAFLTIPIGAGRVYCYCDGPLVDDPPSLRTLLAGYAEPVPTLLAALEESGGAVPVQAGPVEEVAIEEWSRGGVLLIGDAAHATSPNMAQGAAMAVEDALVLAETLAAADDIAAALAAYERRRRPRTDWVLAQTHRRDRTRTLHPTIRAMALKHLGQRMFEANYRPLRNLPQQPSLSRFGRHLLGYDRECRPKRQGIERCRPKRLGMRCVGSVGEVGELLGDQFGEELPPLAVLPAVLASAAASRPASAGRGAGDRATAAAGPARPTPVPRRSRRRSRRGTGAPVRPRSGGREPRRRSPSADRRRGTARRRPAPVSRATPSPSTDASTLPSQVSKCSSAGRRTGTSALACRATSARIRTGELGSVTRQSRASASRSLTISANASGQVTALARSPE